MKQITPETLYDFQFVSNPRFSPDGKHLAFVVQQADNAPEFRVITALLRKTAHDALNRQRMP